MTARPIDVLHDELVNRFVAEEDARIMAAQLLGALRDNGLYVNPASPMHLSSLWGFLGAVVVWAGRLGIAGQRTEQWRTTVRSWIPDERHEEDEP